MTIRDQIINALGVWGQLDDASIAQFINRPVPSVRRARLALEREGVIEQAPGSEDLVAFRWKLRGARGRR